MDEHYETSQKVMKAIKILALEKLKEPYEAIDELVKNGFERFEAEQLWFLVPFAIARPLLSRLGIKDFPVEFDVDTIENERLRFNLGHQHIFTCALAVAEKSFNEEFLPKEVIQQIIFWSPEFLVVNNALSDGIDIKESQLFVSVFYSILSSKVWTKLSE